MSDSSGFSIDVDGERFVVRRSESAGGGFDFDWVSGPNPGYGFSSASLVGNFRDERSAATEAQPSTGNDYFAEHARNFLSMIDPTTGFVADS